MKNAQKNSPYSIRFNECYRSGKKRQQIQKKRLSHQKEQKKFEETKNGGQQPARPKGHLNSCKNCFGSGLLPEESLSLPDTKNFPNNNWLRNWRSRFSCCLFAPTNSYYSL